MGLRLKTKTTRSSHPRSFRIGFLLISLAMEGGAVFHSYKNEPKAITKNIGNIIAIAWIAFQFLLTLGIIAIILTR